MQRTLAITIFSILCMFLFSNNTWATVDLELYSNKLRKIGDNNGLETTSFASELFPNVNADFTMQDIKNCINKYGIDCKET